MEKRSEGGRRRSAVRRDAAEEERGAEAAVQLLIA